MKEIELREYQSKTVTLNGSEVAALRRTSNLPFTLARSDEKGAWRLKATSVIGNLEIEGLLSVTVRPKMEIGKVFWLASYALGEFKLRDLESFQYPEDRHPVEVMAFLFANAARSAFARGLLHGYRTKEEALLTVRGRIRFGEQIRKRFGIPLPVEVRYDDFTEDVVENRLVKAATHALGAMRLRDSEPRAALGRVYATLENVNLVHFAPQSVPEVTFNRLNEHYRQVVGLARIILRHATVATGRDRIRAPGFLMDMNKVFEGFVRCALREELRLAERFFPEKPVTFLDEGHQVWLEPDLAWRTRRTWRFVGDAKYKRIEPPHAPSGDLYQLLAYITALDLPGGMLVYADGEPRRAIHRVRHTGKQLEVVALDLAATPADVLAQVREVATRVRAMASDRGAVRAA